jgi:hypothetical protein
MHFCEFYNKLFWAVFGGRASRKMPRRARLRARARRSGLSSLLSVSSYDHFIALPDLSCCRPERVLALLCHLNGKTFWPSLVLPAATLRARHQTRGHSQKKGVGFPEKGRKMYVNEKFSRLLCVHACSRRLDAAVGPPRGRALNATDTDA